MRITSSNAYESSISQLQRRQQQLSQAQEQLTSGKRVLRPSDDPAGAARAERAMTALARHEANGRALAVSRNAMQLTESALGDAGELMQQARELVISAGNGGLNDDNRASIAQQIGGLRAQLLSIANRTDGAGRYLFGGQGADSAPLVESASGVTYVGTAGQQQAAAGESTPLTVDGRSAWLSTPDPASPGATLSVFDTLDAIVASLNTAGQTPTQIAATVGSGLKEIDATSGTLLSWRARAGEALNRIDGIEQRLGQAKLDSQRERSDAEDLDMVAAISDFQNRQTGYDAALKTYSLVQKMSLFDYIR